MNQELLTRLFRSINSQEKEAIYKIANLIIEDQVKKGHEKFAETLKSILNRRGERLAISEGEFRNILPQEINIPKDKRYNFPLASLKERNELRYEMVLPTDTENKIKRIEKEYKAKNILAEAGLKYKQKILLYGSSGCGKSMCAERIAWNLDLPFLKVKFETIISSYLGETSNNLARLFKELGDYPCVLLLDEFDIIARKRDYSQDVGEVQRIVNMLLTLLEDYNTKGLLIATTNLEKVIDQALFRRFDEMIEIPRPGEEEISQLISKALFPIKKSEGIDWNNLINQMAGLSAAIIVKIANDAAKLCVIGNYGNLTQSHLEKAIKENTIYIMD